ncbi:hypothetical protein G6F46_009020 [Rhizopus delemar]|uniref:Uncharacterized protein n=2 Tax=Rhizopus TaxID=4842 RepID=A0A9P6Z446_9FUNG|nr:hypothetical protein G6F36_012626 [Rhizopus arrhizus]KAG1459041.1 hypothetical protein G6F55_005000 [Rhizopus delemar]KAG1492610.1 hypothetical protein G6F54_009183 [Rhizopus delemar]KAG1507993.1 hypothetical protein G6F52_011500 [Rhizopus delemar]KAG1517703.1 hypothetical protein G6F53_001169 [Rhizopus delemar]
MLQAERSRTIRWRLGWLPGGILKPCIYHPNCMLTKSHAITCLHMHRRLQMSHTIADPLFFSSTNCLTEKRHQLHKIDCTTLLGLFDGQPSAGSSLNSITSIMGRSRLKLLLLAPNS